MLLQRIDSRIPKNYGETSASIVRTYALYVLKKMGANVSSKARAMLNQVKSVDKLPLTAIGFLLHVIDDTTPASLKRSLLQTVYNRMTETAGDAHFITKGSQQDYLTMHSARRVDAIVLSGLISADPASDAIPKLVRGLLKHRVKGRWNNTQENVFVLLALDAYFARFEKETPDFVAKIWLGQGLAGTHRFKGRQPNGQQTTVPMSYLSKLVGEQPLTIAKEGSGRLYYRLAFDYAPTDLKLEPADHGFTVQRTYEAVDHAADVEHSPDGKWIVKAGALVRVRVKMSAPGRRYHVALIDPLPAGFEAVNLGLAMQAGPASGAQNGNRVGSWYWSRWYEHQNMRDERVEAFTSLLWSGDYEYEYIARATTPGTFVVPPAKAEEMYAPETFGRSQTDYVTVK